MTSTMKAALLGAAATAAMLPAVAWGGTLAATSASQLNAPAPSKTESSAAATPLAGGVQAAPAARSSQASRATTPAEASSEPQAGGVQSSASNNDASPSDDQNAEIVVTGIRQSLAQGLDIKRNAVGIVDSIVAEDIGKFPEANIADALVRIPGVELVRDDNSGEGSSIRLRGLPAEFNVTTINGAAINLGATRSFRYDLFPSELFGRVDVYKTPLARLVEGGVAGATDLRTPRPFDIKGRVLRYTVAGNYNDFSGKYNPRGNILFSDRFFDDKFGIVVSVAGARTDNARTGFDASGNYSGARAILDANGNFVSGGNVTGITTPAFEGNPSLGGVAYDWNFATPGTNLNGFSQSQINNGLLPRFLALNATTNDRQRFGVTSTLQFKSGGLDIAVSGIYAKLKDVTETQQQAWAFRDAFRLPNRGGTTQNPIPAELALIPVDVRLDDNNNIQGTVGNLQYQNISRFNRNETKFRYISADIGYEVNDWLRMSLVGATSQGDGKFNQAQLNGLTSVVGRDTVRFDTTDPIFPTVQVLSRDLLNPAGYNYITNAQVATRTAANASVYDAFGLAYSGSYRTDQDKQTQLRFSSIADWNVGGLSGVFEAGAQYFNNRKRVSPTVAPNVLNAVQVNGQPFSALTREQKQAYVQTTLTQVNLKDVAPGGADTWPPSWLAWNRAYFDGTLNAFEANINAPLQTLGVYSNQEKILALYAQSDFRTELFGNSLRGNFGMRYVRTRTTTDNFKLAPGGTFAPVNQKGGYENWLPSASLVYNLTPKLLVRSAWGKTLTRADVGQIAAPLSIPNNGTLFVRVGNPSLRPQQSTSLDLAAEWYFDKGGIISATYFKKDIKDRPFEVLSEVPFNELGLSPTNFTQNIITLVQNNPATPVTVATQINQQKYAIKGWEFSYQQNFRFLPSPLDGLGAIGSLTLVDTQNLRKRVPNLPGDTFRSFNIVPKTTYAVTAFWEKGPIAVRSSYNWKDEVANFGANDSNQIGFQRFQNPRGYLDASIAYKVLKNLELRLDGQNLTNTKVYDFLKQVDGLYGDPKSRVTSSLIAGRVFTLSARGSF